MVKNKATARLCRISWSGLSLSLSLSPPPSRLGPIKAGSTCLSLPTPFILKVPLDPAGAGSRQTGKPAVLPSMGLQRVGHD